MENEEEVKALVRASGRVLRSFRDGRSPTFEQLDWLEAAISVFTDFKTCGHTIFDQCNCEERRCRT